MALVEAPDDVASLISAGDFDRYRFHEQTPRVCRRADVVRDKGNWIERHPSSLAAAVVVDVANSGAFSTGAVVVTSSSRHHLLGRNDFVLYNFRWERKN